VEGPKIASKALGVGPAEVAGAAGAGSGDAGVLKKGFIDIPAAEGLTTGLATIGSGL